MSILLLCAGCPAEGDEVQPNPDEFYFPTGLALSSAEDVLFVANANSDLRFDSGSVIPVDAAGVAAAADAWVGDSAIPSGCDVDSASPFTLICAEAPFTRSDASVRIGNFATELDVQQLDNGDERLFVAVRGDPSLTWIDFDGSALRCGGRGGFPQCNDDHRLTQMRNDLDLFSISDEPFGLFVDSQNGYVVITHLTSGAVTLATAPVDGDEPILADAVAGLFAADPVTGVRGAVGAAGRLPGSEADRIYVTSRSEARIQTLTVVRPEGSQFATIVPGDFFFLTGGVQPSDDSRGIAFSPDGNRGYIVNRDPPLLHVIDTSMSELGVPKNEFLGGIELCRGASNLVVGDVGRGNRVYIACFQDGQVWSIDPEGFVVDAITDVGRGPQAVAVSPEHQLVFASNFLENTIAVIDVEPGSVTENRVVLRLGQPGDDGGS